MDIMAVIEGIIRSLLIVYVLYMWSFLESMLVEFYRTTISKHADAPIYDILCSKKVTFYRVPVFVFLYALISYVPHPFNHVLETAGAIILSYPALNHTAIDLVVRTRDNPIRTGK